MADDKKTQVVEPGKDTPGEDSYEKRYKDLQAHKTKLEQDMVQLKEIAAKDKELLDAVTPYVNWDAVSGRSQPKTEDDDPDGYVDKKTLQNKLKDIQDQIWRNSVTQNFRTKHPDMVAYEDLVGVFLNKTDPRHSIDERIDRAVELAKRLIETERSKGRESYEKEKKEKELEEAQASGLSGTKVPSDSKKEPEGESYEEYIKSRKAQRSKKLI